MTHEEPPTPQHPIRVPDPGYDPGSQSAPAQPQSLPPEDLVGQAVERAAEKVAAVTVPGGPPIMSRTEAFVCVAVLVILNCAALWIGLRTGNDLIEHQDDFRVICQIIVERTPPEQARELAGQLAECLK